MPDKDLVDLCPPYRTIPSNEEPVISGITVLSPHEIQLREMRQPIIVTSILSQEAIYNAIQKMQLPNPVILLR
ncbi:hypothetical protein [Microcystis aeruginosa]|uniref:hypothetical protein n=1 Tax=Microcystis aeruginosa TaxID=1126 RepID=UPI001C12C8EE|nr:hypothetical protein [Microcystis aeruginosa]